MMSFENNTLSQGLISGSNVYRPLQNKRNKLVSMSIILLVVGMLFNNVILFKFTGFSVSPSILLGALLLIRFTVDLFKSLVLRRRKVFAATISLLLYEFIVHGVFMIKITQLEWVQSYALLVLSAGFLLLSSNYVLTEKQGRMMVITVTMVAYIMGGLGIVQFVLSNIFGYVLKLLPQSMMVNVVDVVQDSLRFSGWSRSAGISYEYSYYGIGMVVVLAICLTLFGIFPVGNRGNALRFGAILFSVVGILTSLSLTALVLLALVFGGWLITLPRMKNRGTFFAIAFVILLLSLTLVPALSQRWVSIIEGKDRSTIYRLNVSMDIIANPSGDFISNLFGTGVGLEQTSGQLQKTVRAYFGTEFLEYKNYQIDLTNGFTYIAVTMGWIGLAIHIWIIYAVYRSNRVRLHSTLILLLLSIGYFFATGRYLLPEWWALLALITFINDYRLPSKAIPLVIPARQNL